MTYLDSRPLEDKLLEHRIWNTLELKIQSAADEISTQLISAINTLKSDNLKLEDFVQALLLAGRKHDELAVTGLIRLALLCSNETPNRFKALFPAFLLQKGFAVPSGDKMRWCGSSRLMARTLTVERLNNIILSGVGGLDTCRHFAEWVDFNDGLNSMKEICNFENSISNFIYSVSLRLAQGADTNRRGHTATDLIKNKLAEFGFTPECKNTNAVDLAVSTLVDDYDGPRKFDTIVWNARKEIALVCQSQMYSSDVGSIQGKTVEEDYDAVSKLKSKFPKLVSLTNTEGFGCHTTMLSRLNHVLNSRIDGFIQLKTLDVKLRNILRKIGCISLLDIEQCLIKKTNYKASLEQLIQSPEISKYFTSEEVTSAVNLYIQSDQITVSGHDLTLSDQRLPIVCYYGFLDALCELAKPINRLKSSYIAIGGLPIESGVDAADYQKLLEMYSETYLDNEQQLTLFHDKVLASECLQLTKN